MPLKIETGRQVRPQRVTIYGPEGIGKTTIASKFPAPLFLDVEDGTTHLDVARVVGLNGWQDIIQTCADIACDPSDYKTVVIDTIDAAESIAQQFVCNQHSKNGIEDFGYGKGYKYAAEAVGNLLAAFDSLIGAGMHVVLLAHSHLRKFEQPDEAGAYDRYELKLHKTVASMVKEWSDAVLFCNYETFVIDHDGTKKAKGGRRIIHTTHHPCWDAKNRHGLTEKLPLEWKSVAPIISAEEENPAAFPVVLWEMMQADGITEDELREICARRGYYSRDVHPSNYSDDHVDRLTQNWPLVAQAIKAELRETK